MSEKPPSYVTELEELVRKLEGELEKSEDKFLNVFMHNPSLMAINNPETGEFYDVNKAFLEILGYTRDEVIGKSSIELKIFAHDSDRKKIMSKMRENGCVQKLEMEIRTKSGEMRSVELSCLYIPPPIYQNIKTAAQDYMLTTGNDITEHKLAEGKLQTTLKSLRKAVGTTIQVMVSAVETRDPYTSGHQTRSADLARAIATEMGLPQEKIDAIRIAGSIHDIGKLSIPAEILSKPTKLSDMEFSLIKEHAINGYKMMKDVESPWPLAEIVYQHHERIDGSGYPRKLNGNEILIEAKIIAVADVVEAMASHRPYRPAVGLKPALEEITKNKGILYDAKVVDACLKLFNEKRYDLNMAAKNIEK